LNAISCKSNFDIYEPSRGDRQTSLMTTGSQQAGGLWGEIQRQEGGRATFYSANAINIPTGGSRNSGLKTTFEGLFERYIALCGKPNKPIQTAVKICLFYCCKTF